MDEITVVEDEGRRVIDVKDDGGTMGGNGKGEEVVDEHEEGNVSSFITFRTSFSIENYFDEKMVNDEKKTRIDVLLLMMKDDWKRNVIDN